MEERYNSIGGWLLFYIVITCFGIAYAFYAMITVFGSFNMVKELGVIDNSQIDIMLAVMSAFLIIATALSVMTLVAIYKRKTVRKIIIYLVAGGVLGVLSSIILAVMTTQIASGLGVPTPDQSSSVVFSIFRSVVSTLIWCNYFARSRRVAVYMDEIETTTDDVTGTESV